CCRHLRTFAPLCSWVDTCCIDKSSSAELMKAIYSMFAWYRDAARCYVYLSDVSTGSFTGGTPAQQHWNLARWFTQGWKLQELVAPVLVEFFSVEGQRLGNKYSLVQELHGITGIGVEALRGSPLGQLSIDERKLVKASKPSTRQKKRARCAMAAVG
ncbi:HET-domain-containing protein, partial [Lizonia empirigonia]